MINEELFQDFIGNRSDMKKVMTPRAVKMLRNKLNRMEAEGYDSSLLMERSIINGWQGVWPDDSCKAQKAVTTQSVPFVELHTNRKWREGL